MYHAHKITTMKESYQKSTYNSPSRIKRYLHRKRFSDALNILKLKKSDIFLDYGCGDGYLLLLASAIIPPKHLFGFDPAQTMLQQTVKTLAGRGITIVSRLEDLPRKKFSKISCLETCEHLPKKRLTELLERSSDLLEDSGELVVSVPVEIGLPALLKNSFRFMHDQHYDNLTLKNYLKTFLGLPAARNTDQKLDTTEYIFSHIGFNFRKFQPLLSNYFDIAARICSPFPFTGPFFNNTIYYRCVKKTLNIATLE